jgi:predicted aspartyl protease
LVAVLSATLATRCHPQANPFDLIQLSTLPEQDARHIPFRYDPLLSPFIIVQARINGSEPIPVIIDTGVTVPLVFFPWAAEKLGLRPTKDPAQPGASGQAVGEGPKVRLELATEGNPQLRMAEVPSYIASGADLSAVSNVRAAAIIGLPLLRNWTLRLDFASREISVFQVAHGPYRPLGSVGLPIILGQRFAEVVVPFSAGNQAKLMLDTGSTTTLTPFSVVRKLPIAARNVTAISDVFGKVHITPIVLAQEAQLGRFEEKDVPLVVSPSKEMPKLGTDLLRRFRVVIDFRNRLLTLERVKDPPDPQPVEGTTGIRLQVSQGSYVIGGVQKRSPALEAALTEGLRIIDVDGNSMAGLGSVAAKALLNGYAGTTCTLTLEDVKGARSTKTFRRESWFSQPGSAVDGITIRWSAGAPYQVEDVWEDSAAYRKGLRSGDTLTRVNDLDVDRADFNDVLVELSGAKLRLRVKHETGDPVEIELEASGKP